MVFSNPMSSRLVLALMWMCCASSAWACKHPVGTEPNDAQNIARADAVFVAHIIRLEEVRGDAGAPVVLLATYDVIETVKGAMAGSSTIATSYSSCDTLLMPGMDYVVFAARDSDGRLTALGASEGTRHHDPRMDDGAYLLTIKRLVTDKVPSSP